MVAVGYGNPCTAAVWTSPDGLAWTRLPEDLDVFGPIEEGLLEDDCWENEGFPELTAVAAGDAGYVIVGFDMAMPSLRFVGTVWMSPDGANWTRIPHNEGVFGGAEQGDWWMRSVAAGDLGFVAVGIGPAGEVGSATAVWYWAPDQ